MPVKHPCIMSNKDQVLPPAQRARVIVSMYKKTIRERAEYIKYLIDENNTDEWYIMMEGMAGENNEFKHGQYLVNIKLPPAFPYCPPQFFFLTPNGVYEIGVKVCVSIGEYHSNNYSSAQKVSGFVTNLVSGIIVWKELGGGINILKTDTARKRELARASAQYNQTHYADLVDRINKNYEAYSAEWPPEKTSSTTTVATTTTTTTAATTTVADAAVSTTDATVSAESGTDNPAEPTTSAEAAPTVRPGRVARPPRRKLGEN